MKYLQYLNAKIYDFGFVLSPIFKKKLQDKKVKFFGEFNSKGNSLKVKRIN